MNSRAQPPAMDGYDEGAFRIEKEVETTSSFKRFDVRLADTGTPATLTVLNSRFCERPGALAAFAGEIRAVNSIRQQGIAVVVGHGRSAELGAYVVYERMEGMSLGNRLREQGPISARAATSLLRGISAVMEDAHAHGIVHGLLSVDNILLVPAGARTKKIKIIGFGISKLVSLLPDDGGAHEACLEDMLAYASPEQCRGAPIGRHSDIYSLGIIAYEMLYGLRPFPGGDVLQLINCHLRVPPYRPLVDGIQIPDGVETAVFKSLSKRPEDRFSSMTELRGALPSTMPPVLRKESITGDLLPIPSRPVMGRPPEVISAEAAPPDQRSKPARLAGEVVSRMVDEMINQDSSSPPLMPRPGGYATRPDSPAESVVEELDTEDLEEIPAEELEELDAEELLPVDLEVETEELEPEVPEPEVAQPEVPEPEVAQPEVPEPEVAQPEVPEPGETEPEEAGAEEVEPEETEAEEAKAEEPEPEEVEPEEAEPEEAEPEEVEPEETEPEEVEPEEVEPEEAEPEEVEPEEAEPEEVEPEETEPEEVEPEEVEVASAEETEDSSEGVVPPQVPAPAPTFRTRNIIGFATVMLAAGIAWVGVVMIIDQSHEPPGEQAEIKPLPAAEKPSLATAQAVPTATGTRPTPAPCDLDEVLAPGGRCAAPTSGSATEVKASEADTGATTVAAANPEPAPVIAPSPEPKSEAVPSPELKPVAAAPQRVALRKKRARAGLKFRRKKPPRSKKPRRPAVVAARKSKPVTPVKEPAPGVKKPVPVQRSKPAVASEGADRSKSSGVPPKLNTAFKSRRYRKAFYLSLVHLQADPGNQQLLAIKGVCACQLNMDGVARKVYSRLRNSRRGQVKQACEDNDISLK